MNSEAMMQIAYSFSRPVYFCKILNFHVEKLYYNSLGRSTKSLLSYSLDNDMAYPPEKIFICIISLTSV
jgi:hypothetical protein